MENNDPPKKKGYQLMMLSELDKIAANPKYFDIAVAMYHWLIPELYHTLQDQLSGIQLEVITINYFGAYPSLGIHYENPNHTHNVGDLVETEIYRLLREKPAMEFITFIANSGKDWKAIAGELLVRTI